MYIKSPQQKRIEQMVYSQTPIDTIRTVHENRDYLEVKGYTAKGQDLIYRFYENGKVEKQ